MFSAVIFDMDGLLLDTERLARDSWNAVLADEGLQLPNEIYLQVVGRNMPDTVAIFKNHFGEDFPFAKFRPQLRAISDQFVKDGHLKLRPGASDILQFLSELQIPCALGTSTGTERASFLLSSAGIKDYFRALSCGDEVANGKPAPDIFLLAAKRLGVTPDKCLVFEDSNAGIHAAHSAGMIPIMVPDLQTPDESTLRIVYKKLESLFHAQELVEEMLSLPRQLKQLS